MIYIPYPTDTRKTKEKIINGVKQGITSVNGLLSEGRGEIFDILMNKRLSIHSIRSIEVSVAQLLLAKNPVISVNGNTAVIVPKELIELSNTINAPLEVNLFYRSEERVKNVVEYLKKNGADVVLGAGDQTVRLEEIEHARGLVDERGIKVADTILVALEDGDRAEKLISMGKKIIAIDLNPFSRTANMASITIVGNVLDVIPAMISYAKQMKNMKREELDEIVKNFDNKEILRCQVKIFVERLEQFINNYD
ncbi:MAG: phosphopantothenate/pantothenate synthetase [Candidatus Methanoliparum thermophilum]|uniref:Phosphopantothenate/pantothenate synthetase n=1 Tax=Methanoliparum thermophilum TaxID=2491083 RepID=A0A520KTY2_METT2|nr:phosphopantothenate/pantothenate synthetase [Candidatus Methanoliparum sp. LAM-1]RZN65537.1 MAG: phosphopantothenate/pantothenate synthetase [Candidatus Methanoliparum thermophilum]BDC35366.1 hypothetical protein MTLP_00480 [Candidatus Methanoliparum sp. LAM-1]